MKSVLRQVGIQEAFFAYRQALISETKADTRMDMLLESDASKAELRAQEQTSAEAGETTDAAFAALDQALLARLAQGPDEASV